MLRLEPNVELCGMSTVTEIRKAIRNLPAHEVWKLAEELREHLDALWDKQFEQDVKAGRLDDVIARAREEHATGNTRPLDEISGTSEFWQRYRELPSRSGRRRGKRIDFGAKIRARRSCGSRRPNFWR